MSAVSEGLGLLQVVFSARERIRARAATLDVHIEGLFTDCYNRCRSTRSLYVARSRGLLRQEACLERLVREPACARSQCSGQVAQVVERSPEKAGVGGSTPSLATMFSKDLS